MFPGRLDTGAGKQRMTQSIKRPALRYHGGKWKLAPWIISHFPDHRIYTEAFGGGGSVLLRKPRSYAEVYNDLWQTVVNVFEVLRDKEKAEQLKEQLILTPFAREEFLKAGEASLRLVDDPIEKARLTIFKSFAGFGSASTNSEYATGFRCNSNRSGTTPAHDWQNYPDHIDSFVERLRGVVIENRPAIDVIKQHDGPETLHYIDPPYVHSTRNMNRGNAAYAHELTDEDHKQLAEVLHQAEGMILLSGYASEMYEGLYSDWHRVAVNTHGDGAVDRQEILWMNKACESRQAQGRLFG